MTKVEKCGTCGHSRDGHIYGHECVGEVREGGYSCNCSALHDTSCVHGAPSCEECVEHDTAKRGPKHETE